MALPKGMKLTLTKVSQTLDTEKLFKKELSRSAKKLFGEKIIEKMNLRTVSGIDYRGKNFGEYSKGYAAQKGVSRSAVDMVLRQKMLPSIKSKNVETSLGDLEISVSGRESKKAFAHMTAFKGHPTINKGKNKGKTPKRLFFGFKQDELKKIVTEVKKEIPNEFKRVKKDEKLTVGDIRNGLSNGTTAEINAAADEFAEIFEGL